MKNILYIDSFALVGRRGAKDEKEAWTTEQLLDEMAHCGIHGALICHDLARLYDPAFGNRELAAELKKSPRLYGCWVLMPHQCGEMPSGQEIVKQMLINNIRAAKMCPKIHRYYFDEETCGEIFSALEEKDIPLLVEAVEPDPETLKEVGDVCRSHPALKVLFQGATWSDTRMMVPLMERHPNLYTEFSSLQANRAIEMFTKKFGPERLFFGTEALMKSPGAAKSFIDYAQISDEDRRLIAGENLARFLKLSSLPDEYERECKEDAILARVKEGKPLDDILVIDAHAHMVHRGGWGVGTIPMPYGDVGAMVECYAVIGVGKFCASSWLGITVDAEKGNEIIREAMNMYPEKVIGYATIDPNYTKDMDAEIRKCHEKYGMKGLKPYYPYVKIPYNSPKYRKWWEYANEHRLFALLHGSGENFPREVEEISEKYPEVNFLLAHSGGNYTVARQNCELAKKKKNVFLEITLTTVTYGVIEFMAEEVGAEKIIFGTDAPMRDPIPQLGWLAYTRLSEEEKRKILGENMQKILDRCK